ncbi:MAG: hypothetical protein KC501_28915 [Myxococcales bacterium]|nr:hypothetical protein [Myxococcales bacterium]
MGSRWDTGRMIGFPSSSRRRLPLLLAALALGACPADEPPATTNGSSGDETGPATDGTTTMVSADESGSSGDDASTGANTCGNGMLEPGEVCDDGNTTSGDGCSATCQPESCAMVWSWTEPVDDGDPGANDTTVDGTGNVYVVGDTPGPSDNDIWVAKWNPDGSQAWSQRIDSGNGIDVGLGIAVDEAGEVYIAGRVAGDGDAMYYARLASADGSEVWAITIDSMFPGEDDIGVDAALTPDGDVVVAGRLRVGDGDDDLWLSRRAGADGSEVWATTWSGVGDGTFSTDRVGDLDVGPDGNVWVTVREHVAFDTQDVVLLGYDANGNQTVSFSPLADGLSHTDDPVGVAAYEGGAYFGAVRSSAVAVYLAWLFEVDASGAELWSIDQDQWLGTIGDEYVLRSVDARPDGTVMLGGDFRREAMKSDHEWREAWVMQLDPAGDEVCRGGHMEDDGAPYPPVLYVYSGGAASSGGLALSGRVYEGAGIDSWLWSGYFAM